MTKSDETLNKNNFVTKAKIDFRDVNQGDLIKISQSDV